MRKLEMMIFVLLLTMLTFTVGAAAWLHISNINIVDGITLEAGAGDKLEISLDGVNYDKKLDEIELTEILKKLRMTDVTTSNGIDFSQGPNRNYKAARENIDYISFDIWFRVTAEENVSDDLVFNEIYLANRVDVTYDEASTSKGTYVASKGKLWEADITFNNGTKYVERGTLEKYYAKDAVRIGFSSKDNTFIYDVSENPERGYGETIGAFDYYNLKNPYNRLTVPKEKPTTTYELSKLSPAVGVVLDENSLIVILEKENDYYIGKAKLNIWIEGWDADAFEPIFNDHMLMQLEFKAGKFIDRY